MPARGLAPALADRARSNQKRQVREERPAPTPPPSSTLRMGKGAWTSPPASLRGTHTGGYGPPRRTAGRRSRVSLAESSRRVETPGTSLRHCQRPLGEKQKGGPITKQELSAYPPPYRDYGAIRVRVARPWLFRLVEASSGPSAKMRCTHDLGQGRMRIVRPDCRHLGHGIWVKIAGMRDLYLAATCAENQRHEPM